MDLFPEIRGMIEYLADTSAKIAGSLAEHAHSFAGLLLELIAHITQVTEVLETARVVVALTRPQTVFDRCFFDLGTRLNKSTILSSIIRRNLRESHLVLVIHRPSPYMRCHPSHTLSSVLLSPQQVSWFTRGRLDGKK
jgi:hypothetical protein